MNSKYEKTEVASLQEIENISNVSYSVFVRRNVVMIMNNQFFITQMSLFSFLNVTI